MKSNYLMFSFLIIGILSFKNIETSKPVLEVVSSQYFAVNNNQEGLILLKENCYSCHSVKSKSYNKTKAPPMEWVKSRYKKEYKTQESFTNAFTKWVMKPTKEKSLLIKEVKHFKLMPKLPFYEDDVLIIAKYIYNNKLEKPIWFDSYYKE